MATLFDDLEEMIAAFAEIMSPADAALLLEDVFDWGELPSALDYEIYDATTVYNDTDDDSSSDVIGPDLDFVEDDDAAHEFDT